MLMVSPYGSGVTASGLRPELARPHGWIRGLALAASSAVAPPTPAGPAPGRSNWLTLSLRSPSSSDAPTRGCHRRSSSIRHRRPVRRTGSRKYRHGPHVARIDRILGGGVGFRTLDGAGARELWSGQGDVGQGPKRNEL